MSALPSPLIEGGNGVLLVIMFWMLAFNGFYLIIKWLDTGRWFGGWKQLCRQNPAAVALFAFLIGIEARTFILWWFRHMENHGIDPVPYKAFGILLFTGGTIAAIWGGVCWIRVIPPFDQMLTDWVPDQVSRRRVVLGIWLLMVASALIFGTCMAL